MQRYLGDPRLLEAIGEALAATDLDGLVRYWNPAAERLFGYSYEEMVGRDFFEVLAAGPGDATRADVLGSARARRPWTGEMSLHRRDGEPFRALCKASPVVDDTDTVIGLVVITEDVTEVRVLEATAADRERRLRLALDAGRLGTFQWDASSGVVSWDTQMEAIYGVAPGTFDGSYVAYEALVHPDDREQVRATVRHAVATGSDYQTRHRVVWPDGSLHWVEGRGQPTRGPDGTVTGTIGCSRDITEQMVAEEQLRRLSDKAQRAAGRTMRLQQLTAALAGALTVREVSDLVREQAQLAFRARSGVIVLVDEERRVLRLAASFGYSADALQRWRSFPLDTRTPVTDALRGQTVVSFSAAELAGRYPHLGRPGVPFPSRRTVAVPLAGSAAPLGVLGLGFDDDAPLDEDDRALLTALAGQCGQALERARLYEDTRDVAERLQRALLPQALADVPGWQIAAFYGPAGGTARVGGDWYDAFPLADGRVVIAVGDVMGRGIDAAAAMAQMRASARAYAASDPEPAAVLTHLDRLFATFDIPQLVTLLYLLLDPRRGEAVAGSAGHLPPLVLDADGASRFVQLPVGLPLGAGGDTRSGKQLAIPPGTTLLLYTDGLVERRGEDIDTGLLRLAARARALLATDLPVGLDDLVAALTDTANRDDDVTLLAVRRRAAERPTTA